MVGQLAAPVAINDLVKVGVVRNQTDWMIDILTDPAQTGVVIVTVPEEMPVSETLELIARLDAETSIDVASIVMNRVLPELFSRNEEEIFDRLDEPDGRAALGRPGGRRRLRRDVRCRTGGDAPPESGARTSTGCATGSRRGCRSSTCPFLFHRSHGVRATSRIAEALGDELGY